MNFQLPIHNSRNKVFKRIETKGRSTVNETSASGCRCKSNYNFYITLDPRFIQHINLWGLLHLKLAPGKTARPHYIAERIVIVSEGNFILGQGLYSAEVAWPLFVPLLCPQTTSRELLLLLVSLPKTSFLKLTTCTRSTLGFKFLQ